MAMARVLGVELVTLLLLGFVIGILAFMNWSTKREFSALQGDNEKLNQRMLESASEGNTFRYKKRLMESDLKRLQEGLIAKQEEISGLVHRIEEELVSLDLVHVATS